MEVAIDIAPLITKLLKEENIPLGLLQVLTLVKANPGITQPSLLTDFNLTYSRQALHAYVKKLLSMEMVYFTPDDPWAKRKQLWLTPKGEAYVSELEGLVVGTLRGA